MSNITLRVDDDIIKKVRKIAIDKDTTLTAMVRDYLATIASQDAFKKAETVSKLRASFGEKSRDMGQRQWTRKSLYDR